MEHKFLSKRDDLSRVRAGAEIARDIRVILSLNARDFVKIHERKEGEIQCEAVRNALKRRSFDLGSLLENLDGTLEGFTKVRVAPKHNTLWTSFLASHTLDQKLVKAIEEAEDILDEQKNLLEPVEQDTDSSSYSDYSDSPTDSEDSS